jgi:hypothetical protein
MALREGEPLWSSAVEHRDERILVETRHHRITGALNLPRDGYRSRLTDYLNASERAFIPLTNAEIAPRDGSSEPVHKPFIVVSVSQVVFVCPADDTDNQA